MNDELEIEWDDETPPGPPAGTGDAYEVASPAVTRLAPFEVVGRADGRGYTVDTDPDAAESTVQHATYRKRAPAPITPEARERQHAAEAAAYDRQADDHSPLLDFVQATTGLGPRMGRQESLDARRRTSDRMGRAAERFRRDPMGTVGAAGMGALEGISGGLFDELAGSAWAGSLAPDAPAQGEAIEHMRSARDDLRGRAPEVYGATETAGIAGQMAVPGASAESALGRVATMGAEGALYGAGNAIGTGDPVDAGQALDMGAEGALIGGGLGLGLGAGGETARRALRALSDVPSATRRLDDATLAAPRQSGGGISDALQRYESGSSPQARDRTRTEAARSLREADAIPHMGTTRQTSERIDAARRRGFEVLERIATQMGERGATGRDVAARLRESASRDTTAFGSTFREIAEDMAGRIEETYGDRPIDYQSLVGSPGRPGELSRLRDLGAYRTRAGRDVPIPRQAIEETYGTLRGAYDDAVESTLGAAERDAFQMARRRERALRTAAELSAEGVDREAQRRTIGLSEMAAYSAGHSGADAMGFPAAGPLAGTALAVGSHLLRGREPRIRYTAAVTAERLSRLLSSPRARELGRYADVLRAAAARGSEALTAQSYVLAQRDAEYRALLEQIDFDDEPDPYADTPAMGAIEESAGVTP
jgi:hypothetical protein